MSYMGYNPAHPDESRQEELEQLLLHGLKEQQVSADVRSSGGEISQDSQRDEEDEGRDVKFDSDVQGAFGLYAEASQDAATAGLELALGRHFACADYCNQVAEKAAQAVSLLRTGHRVMYDHDLRALGARVGAPEDIQEAMAELTPFHPEAFYAETPPEEADEVISAAQAQGYIQTARRVLRWARGILL